MEIPHNRFKERLASDHVQLGVWVSLADSIAAEIAAGAGFDWLLIDGEHAPNDLRSILHQLQAVAAYPVSTIVRPAIGNAEALKQLLDIGAQTILVPMVETATQASDLVKAMRYPPRGIRGVATARASRWGRVDDYWAGADDQTCLVVQIETMRGLENIDEIVAVDGVDAVFIGPSDLGASLGHLGDPGHQAVSDAVSSALRTVRRLGKPAGVLSNDPRLTHQYLAAGARFVAVAVDTVLLANTLSHVARDARATAESANAEPI